MREKKECVIGKCFHYRRKDELKGENLIQNLRLAQGRLPCKFGEEEGEGDAEEGGGGADYEQEERAVKAKIAGILEGLPELFDLQVRLSRECSIVSNPNAANNYWVSHAILC